MARGKTTNKSAGNEPKAPRATKEKIEKLPTDHILDQADIQAKINEIIDKVN